jgi:hypothetical protein
MFQVPISAPTASRMKIAPTAEVTPPTAASATAATECAFLNAIRLAKAALSIRATCSGPFVASIPKKMIVRASSAISTTIGRMESSMLGGLGCRSVEPPGSAAPAPTGVEASLICGPFPVRIA